jgi:polysaccharide biosynthesis/export protein
MRVFRPSPLLLTGLSAVLLAGCSMSRTGNELPAASFVGSETEVGDKYIIGALDELTVFVWRNPELGAKVQVRPDGRITTPLITDMTAVGKTPAQLADDIKKALVQYIEDPLVSVMVDKFQGTFSQQIRIVGATEKPASLPYRANMTLLDAMIAVGGLSEFAAGDKARLVRHDKSSGLQREYDLKISRLLKRGDTKANVKLEPGDVIIIPESMF